MIKFCKKCNKNKNSEDFNKWRIGKDGLKDYCKECQKEYNKIYREKNKDKLKQKSKEYSVENKDKIQSYLKSDKRKEVKKKYYQRNKDNILEKAEKYYQNNKEDIKKRNKNYRDLVKNLEQYKENRREYNKKWREKNKHIIYWRKIVMRVLRSINKPKSIKTIDILGYTAIDFKDHIESLFLEGMSWENHGIWHIDHIIPVSKFDKNTPVSVINSLDNLQPLWAKDNLMKGNKF